MYSRSWKLNWENARAQTPENLPVFSLRAAAVANKREREPNIFDLDLKVNGAPCVDDWGAPRRRLYFR